MPTAARGLARVSPSSGCASTQLLSKDSSSFVKMAAFATKVALPLSPPMRSNRLSAENALRSLWVAISSLGRDIWLPELVITAPETAV